MRTIQEIINDWKAEYGIRRSGKSGFYMVIPYEKQRDLLCDLVQTMIDEGYEKEQVTSTLTRNMIVDACSAPDWVKSKNSIKTKKIVASNLQQVFPQFYRGPISKYVPKESAIEKPKDISAQDVPPKKLIDLVEVIKNDTAPDPKMDLDFLSACGIDENFFKVSKQ